MNHIGACQAELDRCVGWHPHTFWDKIILLRDQANGDRTVGLDRRAKIAFGEFAAEMQSCRIDSLYIARGMERIGYARDHDDCHHNPEPFPAR